MVVEVLSAVEGARGARGTAAAVLVVVVVAAVTEEVEVVAEEVEATFLAEVVVPRILAWAGERRKDEGDEERA